MGCKVANKVVTWDEGQWLTEKNCGWSEIWIYQKWVRLQKNKTHTRFLVVHNFNFLIAKTKVGSVGKTYDSTANIRGSRSRNVVA